MQFRGRTITNMASMLLVTTIVISSLATTDAVADIGSRTATTAIATRNSTCKRGTMPTKLAMLCWKAMFEVPICLFEIVKAYEGGSVMDIGKPCCRAFVDLGEDCKIEVFHKHIKLFPATEGFCKAIIGAAPIGGGGAKAPPPHSRPS